MSARSKRLLAVILAYLFALGIPLGFRAYFGSLFSLPLLLVPVLVTTTSGVLRRLQARQRWWVTILALIPPAAFAALLMVGILITPYSSYAIWIENAQKGSPSGSVAVIFQLAYGFFASVIAPLFITMGFLFPLSVLAAATVALTAVIFPTPEFFAVTVGLFVLSLFILMARWSHRGHRIAAAVFYLSMFSTCLVLGRLFMGPGKAGGSRLVDAKLYPALRQIATDVYPGLPLLYEVPGYGFSFSARQLGGPTALSSRGMFSVQGSPGSTAYLRTVVYDFYDGQSWGISQDAFQASEEERRYFAFDFYKKGAQARRPEDIELTVEAEYYSRLPTTIDTSSISFPAGIPLVEQGNMNTGILLKRPIRQGERLVIHRFLGESPPEQRTPPWSVPRMSPGMRNTYTQLPKELPADVKELAEIINPDVTDKALVLENIRQFLAIRASYNLRPPDEFESSGDFVASFLLSSNPEGYCVHFATSLVILARLAGIPARYATGFLVYFPEDTGLTEVRGYSSHAWPEVWIDGIGWMTYEATAAVDPQYYELYGEALQSTVRISMNRSTEAQIEALLGRRVTAPPSERRPFTLALPRWAGIAGVSVLGAGLLFVIGLLSSGRVRYLFLRDPERYGYHLKHLVKRMERADVPDPSEIGWVAWWDTLERRKPEHAEELRKTRDDVLRVAYWDGYFTREHLDALRDFRRRYEGRLASRRS